MPVNDFPPTLPEKQSRGILAEVLPALVAGVFMRFLLILLVDYTVVGGDEETYQTFAKNLIEHGIYSESVDAPFLPGLSRAPLFPAFLAIHFALFGYNKIFVALSQALLGLATSVTYYLALKGTDNQKYSKPALWALALCPFDALYFARYFSETLVSFFLAISLTLLYRGRQIPHFLIAGISLGLACLTRDVYLPLLALLPAAYLTASKLTVQGPGAPPFAPAAGRAALTFILGGLVTVLPWTCRNYFSLNRLAPVSKGNLGYCLWVGTWERDSEWMSPSGTHFPEYAFASQEEKEFLSREAAVSPEVAQRDAAFKQAALFHIASEPLKILGVWVKRSAGPWLGTRTELFTLKIPRQSLGWYSVKISAYLVNLLILIFCVMGMLLVLARRNKLSLWITPIAMTFIIYIPLHNTETRYSQPVFPVVLIFAVIALSNLLARRKGTPNL